MAAVYIEDVDVVKETLEELKKNQIIPDYESHKEKIIEVLKTAAQREATLTTQMVPMIDNKNMREVEQAISAIFGRECVHLIKISFVIETYKMKVVKKPDDQLVVRVHRKGVEFQSEIMLMTRNDIEIATWLQRASLVIELLLFLLNCVGIGVDLSEDEMRTLVQEVEGLVQESAFQRALNEFVDAWNEAGGSAWGKAKAIFNFLKESYSLGILWKIIKLIFKLIVQNMSTWEMIKAIIEVVLMIIAALATKGLGLIARIALAVHCDVYLAKKIANLVKFSDMKKGVAEVYIEGVDVVKEASEELKKTQIIPDYESHEENIIEVLKTAAQREATLTTQMVHMIDNKNMREVEQAMSEIIGQDRVDDIKMAFAIETYIMKVVKMADGQSVVQVHRKGVEFKLERMLMTRNDIESATVLQLASLVIELFLFVLSCVGIVVCLNQAEMRVLVQEVEGLVRQSTFRKALDKFLKAWDKAGGSAWKKAKAIFRLLKESYSHNIFWNIIKLIYKDMCKWQKIKAMVEVVLMIVVAFATEGFALIARIALAVDSAVYLAEKIANINKLSDMKKTMK